MKRNPIFSVIREDLADSPVNRRHVLCPRYDECLDEAIAKNRFFHCTECPYKKEGIIAYVIHDGEAT